MIDKLIRLVEVFNKWGVKYLFIGKGAAILYGYPGTTQDIDIFPKKSEENCKNLVGALKELEFIIDQTLEEESLKEKILFRLGVDHFPLISYLPLME